MTIIDYGLLTVIAALVLLALRHMRQHQSGCRGCEGCQYRDECTRVENRKK